MLAFAPPSLGSMSEGPAAGTPFADLGRSGHYSVPSPRRPSRSATVPVFGMPPLTRSEDKPNTAPISSFPHDVGGGGAGVGPAGTALALQARIGAEALAGMPTAALAALLAGLEADARHARHALDARRDHAVD